MLIIDLHHDDSRVGVSTSFFLCLQWISSAANFISTRVMQRQMTGQLSCQGCHVTLAYPLGAPSVRCPMCTTVTPVQQFQVTCVTCRCVLMLPANTSLAMCPRCRTVMSIPPSVSQASSQQASSPPKQCVYIERPSTKDNSGKKISRLCIGTKLDDDPR